MQHMSDTERMILSALQSWSQVIARLDQRLLNLTDEQLERQLSPERVGKLATPAVYGVHAGTSH
jgi:hypothetical protein